MQIINIKNLINTAVTQLENISTTAGLDAELLLCHVLKKTRTYLFAHPEKIVSISECQLFKAILAKRVLQIPVAYLIGEKEFWNLTLNVNEHTLIPRPETELLVEIIIEDAAGEERSVLDLGTGSGAIALALAKEHPQWKISAVDFSLEALKTAKANAVRNDINTVEFFQSDWFSGFEKTKSWDIIVSNPPYLDEKDPHLLTEEIRYEPRSALVAKENGLADIKNIVKESRAYLNRHGAVFIEHGCAQGPAVRDLFLLAGYRSVRTFVDLAGLERVTQGVID